jgi:hypothetical protein
MLIHTVRELHVESMNTLKTVLAEDEFAEEDNNYSLTEPVEIALLMKTPNQFLVLIEVSAEDLSVVTNKYFVFLLTVEMLIANY